MTTAGKDFDAFWAQLPAAQVSRTESGQEVLSLPEGIRIQVAFWNRTRHWLRRRSYNVAFERMMASLEGYPSPNSVNRFLIRGTPGIGKSVFLLDLLHRLACLRRTVVWYAPEYLQHALLFTSDGVFAATSPAAFAAELSDPATWFLCDAVEYPPVEAATVVVSSPRAATYNHFAKTRHMKLWFGPWSLDELEAARSLAPFAHLDADTVVRLFKTWGGIPRFVLEFAENPSMQGELEDALAAPDMGALLRAVLPIDMDPEGSHELVHVKAGELCEREALVFASEEVAARVLERLQFETWPNDETWPQFTTRPELKTWPQVDDYEYVRKFMRWAAHWPIAASLRDALFRAYCHARLPSGGTFRVRDLSDPRGAAFSLELPPVQRRDDVGDLSTTAPGYTTLVLEQEGFPDVNGVLVLPAPAAGVLTQSPPPQVLLFRATASSGHVVEGKSLRRAVAQLPAPVQALSRALFFAVPPDVFETFPEQRVVGSAQRIRQYALEVPIGGFDSSGVDSVGVGGRRAGRASGGSGGRTGGGKGGGAGAASRPSGSGGGRSQDSGARTAAVAPASVSLFSRSSIGQRPGGIGQVATRRRMPTAAPRKALSGSGAAVAGAPRLR